jgi:hypothetical protein
MLKYGRQNIQRKIAIILGKIINTGIIPQKSSEKHL